MSIRVRGFLQFLGAGAIFAGLLYWLSLQYQGGGDNRAPGGIFSLIFMMIPGGFSMAGLIQAISGVPFSELSDKWNSLKGWQRGLYGFGIFLLVATLLFGGIAVYLVMTET